MAIKMLVCGLCVLYGVDCGAFEARGHVGLEQRQFYQPPLYDDTKNGQTSLTFESQLYWRLGEADSLTITPFARLDAVDDRRTHFDLREAKWVHKRDNWDFEVGNALVFWGVAESQHLVDVINQRDAPEDVTGDARLGQPMLHGRYFSGNWTVEGFILPWFRERTFAAAPGRLRVPVRVRQDDPIFESSKGRHHTDYALRGSFTAGGWDVGLSYFRGTNREPILQRTANPSELVPYYEQITQYGVDVQITMDKTLWKLEARHRRSSAGDYYAYVAGLEHSFNQVFGSKVDLSAILEYNWDQRGDKATTAYQDDAFVGLRMMLNDQRSTEAFIGVGIDLEHDSRFGRLRASTRYGKNIRLGLEAYWFQSNWRADPVYAIRNEDHILLSLKYFF